MRPRTIPAACVAAALASGCILFATRTTAAQVDASLAAAGVVQVRDAEAEIEPARTTTLRDGRDGEALTIEGTEVRAYAVPGHTSDGGAYLIRGALFLGDAATRGEGESLRAAPWIFSGQDRRRDEGKQNVVALKRLHERLVADEQTVRLVAMAHSEPLTGIEALATAE
jgi:glyoxylase-like metal-dependent hydrolase (beta-lactamase superfamily II)